MLSFVVLFHFVFSLIFSGVAQFNRTLVGVCVVFLLSLYLLARFLPILSKSFSCFQACSWHVFLARTHTTNVYIERVSSIHSTIRERKQNYNAHQPRERERKTRKFLRSLYFEPKEISLVLICVLQCVDETYSAHKTPTTTRSRRRWRQKQKQHHTSKKRSKHQNIANRDIFAFIAP